MMTRLVSVAVPVPFLPALTYSVPDNLPVPEPGSRVLVPLGTRVVTGCILGSDDHCDQTDIKDLVDCLDTEPLLPVAVLALACWVAEYYACGPGQAIAAAMPPFAWVRSARHAEITQQGRERLNGRDLSGNRRQLLEVLAAGRSIRTDRLAALVARLARSDGREHRRIGSRGVQTLLRSLATEGLIRLSQPLQGRVTAFKTRRVVHLTALGRETVEGEGNVRLGGRQQQAMSLLTAACDGLQVSVLSDRGVTIDTLKRLERREFIDIRTSRVERDPFGLTPAGKGDGVPASRTFELTSEQDAALKRLDRLAVERIFRVALLHGVTGSGKTEVYLRLAKAVLDRGRQVLVLVPEIALTPGIVRVFREAFGERVAIQHSGLSSGERHDQWHRIRRNAVDVVVGTRSAVFAPLTNPGLIIVDEEHDASYKQDEAPRYHGRDVAIVRGQQAGALVVLGSATPSMESYHNASKGRYVKALMTRRIFDRPLAAVRVVDMRKEFAEGGPDVVLSTQLRTAIETCLQRKEQALILLNRRGFAAAVFCRQCGQTLECPNCSVSLTLHRAAGRARCHYCNFSIVSPKSCPQCVSPYLERLGFGTERIESEIAQEFRSARVGRLDRDAVRRRGSLQALLNRFAGGDIDVLVGTQMVAKGHDFPAVTLVGVVSADVGLGLPDFRSAERTFQLLTQVVGRAGRGNRRGEAIIQTLYPEHYSIKLACQQAFEPFFEAEIEYRAAMRYPPVVSMISAVVRGSTLTAALKDASALTERLRAKPRKFEVLGPAPAPLTRLSGDHRAQLFLKGKYRRAMKKALLETLAVNPVLSRRVTIDVDPLSVL